MSARLIRDKSKALHAWLLILEYFGVVSFTSSLQWLHALTSLLCHTLVHGTALDSSGLLFSRFARPAEMNLFEILLRYRLRLTSLPLNRFQVLREHGVNKTEIDKVFGAVDMDSSGRLHYMEFLAATVEARGYIEVRFALRTPSRYFSPFPLVWLVLPPLGTKCARLKRVSLHSQ